MSWLFAFLKRTLESLSEAIRFYQVCEKDLDEVSQKWVSGNRAFLFWRFDPLTGHYNVRDPREDTNLKDRQSTPAVFCASRGSGLNYRSLTIVAISKSAAPISASQNA